jgi:ribosomal silencing factor RsfS
MKDMAEQGSAYIDPSEILKACDNRADCLSRLRSKQVAYDAAKKALEERRTDIIVHDLMAKSEGNTDAIIITGSNEMQRKAQLDAATQKEAADLFAKELELGAARHELTLADAAIERIDLLLRNVGR